MDFHALQQKLFEMDPTDPREDLAKLQQAAQGGAMGDVPPTKDYVAESVDVPQGSMPLGIDSVADFAALAGIRIDEKQKIGSAGQAKGKGPMPSAEPGRTKHPLKDKLVGEGDLDEGPYDAIQQGFDNYNTTGALGGDAKPDKSQDKKSSQDQKSQKLKGGVSGQQLGKMIGVTNPALFAQAVNNVKAGKEITLRTQQASMAEAFQRLMSMNPKETQRVMTLLKRLETETESVEQSNTNEDIKARLWDALNAISKS